MSASDNVVEEDQEYCGHIKIYGVGIKADPVAGSKRGKGLPNLNPSIFLEALARLIESELGAIKAHLRHARSLGRRDFCYLVNQSNALFMRAEIAGLRTEQSKDDWLFASFLALAAAEVDAFSYAKYSREQRDEMREQFYDRYERAEPIGNGPGRDELGRFYAPTVRLDLMPTVALERLALHNELCAVKWGDENAGKWRVEGFPISKRMSSTKRHFDQVHRLAFDEDHIAHLIWNFSAIFHVLVAFPHLNDLDSFNIKS
jgi:hypothetical protein